MADTDKKETAKQAETEGKETLSGGTYEIIRGRLKSHSGELKKRLQKLNQARKQVFGAIETKLLTTERISTDNNCVAMDMVSVGDALIFGYNVRMGLKSETKLSDVFAVYRYSECTFQKKGLELLADERFSDDFKNLYRYYKNTWFSHFAKIGTSLFMVFRVGKDVTAIKTFKWAMGEDGGLTYVDNRSDHEYRLPSQHEFEWTRTTRDHHRAGHHPHVSIEDEIFVETVGGDLTIKVEDNTETGAGIYSEQVENADQTLDDGEIHYAIVGNLILLKILPYQERDFRYIVYNSKAQTAQRIDAIEDACVLLPEEHGIIFAHGFYLQTGEHKQFDSELDDMQFLKRVSSPNGEDTLFVFFNRMTGTFVLLSYNIIEQQVHTPIICHGFSVFENGELIYFRSQDEPQRNHTIQVWQTPYVSADYEMPTKSDSYLYKLGNRDIVKCMAACQGVLTLVAKDESYATVYVDIAKEAADVVDTYFWLDHKDAYDLKAPLLGIRETAHAAIEEFEKVVRLRKETADEVGAVTRRVQEILSRIRASHFDSIGDFVEVLAGLRVERGAIISLKDLRYVDVEQVERLEQEVDEQTGQLSGRCAQFLLTDQALAPYEERVTELKAQIDPVARVTDAKGIETELDKSAGELEMLTQIVSNLKIDDATERTQIIDNISAIYSLLNRARAGVKNKIEELASTEGKAEFASQMKLLDQAVINFLDVCDTPKKCEEYLTKITVQVSELEGRFSDFGEFMVEIAEKQGDIYNTFEARKLALVEERNKKTDALLRSAERILTGMATRVAQLDSVEEVNGFFASDLMVDKVRDIIDQLANLDDSVKSGDVQARLKTLQQDTLRQLKDRKELYVEGKDVIKFGEHMFSVNTQELALTVLGRDDHLHLHLTGTNFFEPIPDERVAATKEVWDQSLVSETDTLYRGEYLAHLVKENLTDDELDALVTLSPEDLAQAVNKFMVPRYAEGYVKGVHDYDGALILRALVETEARIGLLKYSPLSRALALIYWQQARDEKQRALTAAKLKGVGEISRLFDRPATAGEYKHELREGILQRFGDWGLLDDSSADEAAAYLFDVLTGRGKWVVSPKAAEVFEGFHAHLERRGDTAAFLRPIKELEDNPRDAFRLTGDWISAYLADRHAEDDRRYLEEVAAFCLTGAFDRTSIVSADVKQVIEGMVGNHPLLTKGRYTLDFNEFTAKLGRYAARTVPLFNEHQETKKIIVDQATEDLRLDEFRPRVLSSFVRSRLIDTVYLPLVGENLAKQLGVVGENTRTDRMGLLLLISPPGYGKTTLMEYIANRLGIIFMKINGPAIGNRVTSLDPAEAPNAAAREELKKLNLSLEMGDNVMIYLDDIQHCDPELLQKFISLCDAQRKIEGVYKGKTRTYDLRGRKVCVVMAGNPYSESGEAFKIPDMLANRADTYNLGDIIGDTADVFKLSYLENCLTSNAVLSKLAVKNFKDVYGVIRAAETGTTEGIEFEGNYSPAELGEYTSVMKKLLRVRDVILRVNQEYIYSAGQADEYRTEPPFKLQGSYRNMNRLAEKIIPIMNDDELERMLHSHYESEAQTLTTGAEANLLKFKELIDALSEEEAARWDEIRKTFNRNLKLAGVGSGDRMAQVLLQLETFSDGLSSIQETLSKGMSVSEELGAIGSALSRGNDLNKELSALRTTLSEGMSKLQDLSKASVIATPVIPAVPQKLEAVIADDTMNQILRILGHIKHDDE